MDYATYSFCFFENSAISTYSIYFPSHLLSKIKEVNLFSSNPIITIVTWMTNKEYKQIENIFTSFELFL
jgi:hypothetical protein